MNKAQRLLNLVSNDEALSMDIVKNKAKSSIKKVGQKINITMGKTKDNLTKSNVAAYARGKLNSKKTLGTKLTKLDYGKRD